VINEQIGRNIKKNEPELLEVRGDRLFHDLFNENDMDTLEWTVMQILNARYEDIHSKVKVRNVRLVNTYKEERSKYVDLLVNYRNEEILIELNNNYGGNYMRNLLYSFNIILNHYNVGSVSREIASNRIKVILVNLNWYPKGKDFTKIAKKNELIIPYPEDNTNDFLLKIININLDFYKQLCYNEIDQVDKLWKLLTIDNVRDLEYFIKDENLLQNYQTKLLDLSSDSEYRELLMNENIEKNARFEETYGVGYRDGLEQGISSIQNQMIIKMYQNGLSYEIISECSGVSNKQVEEIINKHLANCED